MGKELWEIDLDAVSKAFTGFTSWYDAEKTKFVGVLFGSEHRVEMCVFLSDDHLKRSYFEFVSNSLPADLNFVGVLVVTDHEPNTDISYMGPGLELSIDLSDLQSGQVDSILTSANPPLKKLETARQGVTIVSKVAFSCVLRKGCEEACLKQAVERFAAVTGELAFYNKSSGVILQAPTDVPKVLDSLNKGSNTSRDFLSFTSFRRISACDEGGEEQKHVPVIKVQRDNTTVSRVELSLEVTSPAYFGESSRTIYVRMEEAARRRAYNVLYVMLKGIRKHGKLNAVDTRTFLPPGYSRLISVVLPLWTDSEQKAWRVDLHKLFNAGSRLPCFRATQAVQFGASGNLLRSPHLSINYKSIGEMSCVKGPYDYHHYMQNEIDDNGWGCAYRSLQSIWSWFVLNGFADKPVPMHRHIQETLVKIEGEDIRGKGFVGSRKWIGSFEIGYILNEEFGIECKYIAQFSDISDKAREIAMHFQTVGSPIMIGGNMLAHTILGVDFDENTGECKFLVLDPHYTGGEDIKTITSKGWCAWKPPTFWKTGADAYGSPITYNIVLPQVDAEAL